VLRLPRSLCCPLALLIGSALALLPAVAAAEEFAPVDTPGSKPTITAAQAESVIGCSAGFDQAETIPVLLIQGTGATAKDNWSWTYQPALDKLGIPWCHVDLPDQATGDVQLNGEYVLQALRSMHQTTGTRVSIIGHSQGGMVGRWALRWWPDSRAIVDDVIGFAPSNHGTTMARCSASDPCSPSGWQQRDEADFMRALNSRQETFAGVSYTNIYTRTDEIVQPNLDDSGSSSLRTGDGEITNVATQDVCPTAVNEHLLIGLIDPVAYALAIDALINPGPADPSRVPLTTCAQIFHPGIDPVTGPIAGAEAADSYLSYEAESVPAEPALACYTTASCQPRGRDRDCVAERQLRIKLRPLRAVRITLGGEPSERIAVERRRGRLVVALDLRGYRERVAVLRVRGENRSGEAVKLVRRYRVCGAPGPG